MESRERPPVSAGGSAEVVTLQEGRDLLSMVLTLLGFVLTVAGILLKCLPIGVK